jgi:hypothetical protein
MPYWVKRISLKTGEVVTEQELKPDENYSEGDAPVVGDEISVICRGRTLRAKVVWGNWPGREHTRLSGEVIPLRVEEI